MMLIESLPLPALTVPLPKTVMSALPLPETLMVVPTASLPNQPDSAQLKTSG
jgi:hypothetical protein